MSDDCGQLSEVEATLGEPTAETGGPEDAPPVEEGLQASGLLVALCHAAESHYGLHIGECDAPGAPPSWGPVHRVHAPGSLHYLHRAADISGLEQNMRRFCEWVARSYGAQITELIHNPGCSIKNGKNVPPSYWGDATWNAHRNHVHLGI